MALRIKIRKEIKETLENEGYSKEEIEKDLNDLVEEEILEREKERNRQWEAEQRKFEAEERQREAEQRKLEAEERDKLREAEQRKLEAEERDKLREAEERDKQREHEIALKRLEYDNRSSNNTTQIVDKKEKIQPYDEKGDLDIWFDYFGRATSDWSEEERVFQLKKAFLNLAVGIHIRASEDMNEIRNIIYNHYNLSSEDFRIKFREEKYNCNRSVESYISIQRLNMNKWIGSILDEESIESIDNIKDLFLKEQLYNGFDKDIQRKLMEYTFYNIEIKDITKLLKSYIMARPKDTEKKEESKDTEKKKNKKFNAITVEVLVILAMIVKRTEI